MLDDEERLGRADEGLSTSGDYGIASHPDTATCSNNRATHEA